MSQVEITFDVPASAAEVFTFVDDYRKVPTWMFALEQFEPVGEQDQGLGAVFDGNLKLGVPLKSRVQVTGWQQDHLIELTSIKGIKNAWHLTVEPTGDTSSRVTAVVTYELPGGPVGKGMEKVVKPLVEVCVEKSISALRRQLAR